MMKGTPCSSRDRASLKTLRKTHYRARSGNPAKRVRAWALVGRKRGNIPSPLSAQRKLRIVLLTAGGLAPHLIGRLVFSQPDVNRVPQ
jgi:hypothetical protein